MSEMLGNQYFLGRDYAKAATELYAALKTDLENKGIRRKLIICFTIPQVKLKSSAPFSLLSNFRRIPNTQYSTNLRIASTCGWFSSWYRKYLKTGRLNR